MEYFKTLTLQEHINTVGLRFQIQYKNDKARVEIGEQIDAIPNPKSKEEIDEIIGNSSWTTIRCYICENSVDKLVGLYPKSHDEYDNHSVHIFKKCIDKAKELIDSI